MTYPNKKITKDIKEERRLDYQRVEGKCKNLIR